MNDIRKYMNILTEDFTTGMPDDMSDDIMDSPPVDDMGGMDSMADMSMDEPVGAEMGVDVDNAIDMPMMGSPIGSSPTVGQDCDDDYDNSKMLQSTLMQIKDNAQALCDILRSGKQSPSWALAKVSRASENLEGVHNYMKYKDLVMEGKKPTKPKLWESAKAAAKKKFTNSSTAYANGWAMKLYEEKGGNWRK